MSYDPDERFELDKDPEDVLKKLLGVTKDETTDETTDKDEEAEGDAPEP